MKNGTLLEYFHWYVPGNPHLWTLLHDDAPRLADMGITAVWIPPAGKGTEGKHSVGYDVYDIYDLGEFDQKNSVRTKYGTRRELVRAANALRYHGVQLYVDVVLNHMGGADEKERVLVRRVDPENRNEFISDPFEIEAYTKFTFPGRKGKYSQFVWDFRCFTGIDYAADLDENGIFSIVNNEYGEGWEEVVDDEKGNYDYLMFADIEFRNPAVREELKRWGKWLFNILHFGGVRLDAVKHITPRFYNEWLDFMRSEVRPDLFAVGEYWSPGNPGILLEYIRATEGRMSLFDAVLQNNFHKASKAGNDYDLTTIFQDALVEARPDLAVTLVANHDTQPLQALEAPVEPWFKPLAYAIVLLREKGYPCVFYPDLYGAQYSDRGQDGNSYDIVMPKIAELESLIRCRRDHAYGPQRDYFDHANCVGWTRGGDEEHEGCAVLLTNGDEGFKTMEIGERYAGRSFVDALGKRTETVIVDKEGNGEFLCAAGSVSVWVCKP